MSRNQASWIGFLGLGILLGYLLFGLDSESRSKPLPNEVINENVKWTCSMHPHIHGEEGQKCALCGMDLTPLNLSETVLSDNQFTISREAAALANIETITISKDLADAPGEIKLSGIITTNKETDAVQTFLFDGRLDKLYPNTIGEKVYKGQEIGEVYSPELYIAQDKLLTSVSYKNSHEKLYDAARNTLGLWKVTDAQIEEMIQSGKPLKNFPFYADNTGTVMEVYATEGNYYKEGQPLYKVSDLRKVWVELDAYESHVPFLELGQESKIYVKALNKEFSGKVDFIDPIVNTQTRSMTVRVALINEMGLLKPGMFVEGKLKTKPLSNSAIVIPKSAVLWTGKRSVVYRELNMDTPVYEMVQVLLGHEMADAFEVLEGIKPGDRIVVNGTFTVDAAAQLNGKKSMMHVQEANDGLREEHHSHELPEGKLDLNIGLLRDFPTLLPEYIEIKDALVSTDYKEVKVHASMLLEGIRKLETSNREFDDSQLEHLKFNLEAIKDATDIENQRIAFKKLSELFISYMTTIEGQLPKKLYIQHCDCVPNGGGSWLSYDEGIFNPYFGDKMLTCGWVDGVIE